MLIFKTFMNRKNEQFLKKIEKYKNFKYLYTRTNFNNIIYIKQNLYFFVLRSSDSF